MKDVEIKVNGDDFILVDVESLSMDDEFMQYEVSTIRELTAKYVISNAICSGVKNFYRPKCDPSFTNCGESICFAFGKKPAVGKSYNWWESNAKEFCPERNSRLGTKLQYGAFLGVLIKKLVESGWEVATAWNAVCNDSRELGHYLNSEGASYAWEPTGSREICGFFDLANAYKILAEDEEADGFWLTDGTHYNYSYRGPLANLNHDNDCFYDEKHSGVGWVVLDA